MTLPLRSDASISSVEPMFSLYCTLKPFASSACLYSWPSTYCSGKSFVPMMIGVACCLSSAAGAAAAPPSTMATPSAIAKAALAARRLCFLITCLLLLSWFTRLDDRAHIRFERRKLLFQSLRV